MEKSRLIVLASALALASAASTYPAMIRGDSAQADTAQPFPTELVAVTGIVEGVAQLSDDSVIAFALLDSEAESSMQVGDALHPSLLPDEDVAVDGNTYYIVVDPAFLPRETIGDTGLVNFRILVQDPSQPEYATLETSARAVTDNAGNTTWADPLQPNMNEPLDGAAVTTGHAPTARTRSLTNSPRGERPMGRAMVSHPHPVTFDVGDMSIHGQICSDTCAPARGASPSDRIATAGAWSKPPSSSSIEDDDDGSGHLGEGKIEAPDVYPAGSSCPPGGLGDVMGATKEWEATIGTAYPRGQDTAWLTYRDGSSAEFTTKLGVALYDYGVNSGWESSGTKTLERGSGFDWAPKLSNRSFRITNSHQKISHYYDRCPGDKPYTASWVPKTLNTGGYNDNQGIPVPDFVNCRTVYSEGTWWRQESGGTAYSYGAGVKSAGTIGIDLSVVRAYNAEARLAYYVHPNKRMCGNNADGEPVGAAGKIMEKPYL